MQTTTQATDTTQQTLEESGARIVGREIGVWHIGVDDWSTRLEEKLYNELRNACGVPMDIALVIRPMSDAPMRFTKPKAERLSDFEAFERAVEGHGEASASSERIEPGRLSQNRDGLTPKAMTCPRCGCVNGHYGWSKECFA